MKNVGKLASVLMIITIVCCSITFVSAVEIETPVNGDDPEPYEVVCGGLPYHRMTAHGSGTVYLNGSIYISNGFAWECSNCGRMMWTQGGLIGPGYMNTIGNYAEIYYPGGSTSFQIVLSADYYGYTSSNSLQGYSFFSY